MKVNKTTVLTIGACVGVPLTGYLAFRAGQQVGNQKTYPPRANWRIYIPPIAVGAATIVAIVLGQRLNRKEILALTATGTYLAMNRDELEKQIREKYGDEALDEIKQKVNAVIAPKVINKDSESIESTGFGETLCIDRYSGRKFRSSLDAVNKGIAEVNDYYMGGNAFSASCPVCFNDFYEAWGIIKTQFGDQFGWPSNEDFFTGPINFEVTYIHQDELPPWAEECSFGEDIIYIECLSWPMECWMEL